LAILFQKRGNLLFHGKTAHLKLIPITLVLIAFILAAALPFAQSRLERGVFRVSELRHPIWICHG